MSISNTSFKLLIIDEYNSGAISQDTFNSVCEVVDKFKPQSNYFGMPGDFDDRFSETLNNIYRHFLNEEKEAYYKDRNLEGAKRREGIPKVDMVYLMAKAFNSYADMLSNANYEKMLLLVDLEGKEVLKSVYRSVGKKHIENFIAHLNENAKKLLRPEDESERE